MSGKKLGRPLKFQSVEELSEKIDNYFKSVKTQARADDGEFLYDQNGEPIYIYYKAPTLAGLALFLDCDTSTLKNYSKDEDKKAFFPTINRARQIIEVYNSESVYDRDKYKGARFMLEVNNDYQVAQKVDLNATAEFNITLTE